MGCVLLNYYKNSILKYVVTTSMSPWTWYFRTTQATYFKKFSVVIATDVPEDQLLRLAALLWENNTPLLVGRAYGLLGYYI